MRFVEKFLAVLSLLSETTMDDGRRLNDGHRENKPVMKFYGIKLVPTEGKKGRMRTVGKTFVSFVYHFKALCKH